MGLLTLDKDKTLGKINKRQILLTSILIFQPNEFYRSSNQIPLSFPQLKCLWWTKDCTWAEYFCECASSILCSQKRRSNRQVKRKKYAEELEARLSDDEVKVIVKAKKTNAASKGSGHQLFVVSISANTDVAWLEKTFHKRLFKWATITKRCAF